MTQRQEDAEGDFAGNHAGKVLNLRVKQQGYCTAEVADDICPFATKFVRDPAGWQIQKQRHNRENCLTEGDLLLIHTDRVIERGHDGCSQQAGRDDRFQTNEIQTTFGLLSIHKESTPF